MVGRSISHFQVTEKLGEGGMGVVYKARDNRLDRMVAIKVLSAGAVANAVANHDRQLRFVQEAKSASALNHPNIVTIHEIDTTGDVAFIAMEFIEGETLAQVIPPRGLPFSNAINYAIQIAGALAAAHAVGIVHRDLKPANIMIAEKGLVKVLDFGLAKLTRRGMAFGDAETGSTVTINEPQTEAGLILGTVSYMSPEQAEGKKIDARSDIFSFGAVLYEMLTGHRAFSGQTKLSTIAAILNQEPKPLAAVRGVPRDLERIVSRCLRKNPDRRFQVMADVKVALEDLKEESESGKLAAESLEPRRKSARTLVFSAAAVAFLLLAMALSGLWWTRPRNQPTQGPLLVRLTTDSGLTSEPAISADGKLVAYASDRAARGDLDIWVQQANGGSPIRVTFDKADDHQPAFSPDGATVAFRSERQGGGIYVVPALGGEPRLISKQGYDPTFSPDGSQIAYWTGAGVSASTQSQIYVVPASGGISRAAQSELKFARHPIWTPDGKHLLFWGANPNYVDWWVAELGREGASQSPVKLVRTGTTEAVSGRNITNSVVPWSWLGEQVLFVAPFGDSMDLWSVPLSARDWHVTAPRRRLTTGVEIVNHPSAAADGRIVFASLRSEVNVWSLAADANTGKVTGRLEQITYGAGQKTRPALSRDGSKLAFGVGASPEKTLGAIVLKDLRTARETPVAMASSLYPTLNADGTKIAYVQIVRDGKMQIYIARSSGDVPEKVCDDCGLTPAPWSSNSLKLLYDGGVPQTVGLFDLVTRKKTELLRLPGSAVTQASFSPDDRWICFLATKGPGRSQVHVIPYREGSPAPPQAEWMAVTDGAAFEGLPRWSPDGKLIYFISDRDGFRCLWAQRVNPGNKNPAIAPFAVAHFHEARRSLTNVGGIGLVGLGVSRDRIVFNLGELTGNIWMAQPAPAN